MEHRPEARDRTGRHRAPALPVHPRTAQQYRLYAPQRGSMPANTKNAYWERCYYPLNVLAPCALRRCRSRSDNCAAAASASACSPASSCGMTFFLLAALRPEPSDDLPLAAVDRPPLAAVPDPGRIAAVFQEALVAGFSPNSAKARAAGCKSFRMYSAPILTFDRSLQPAFRRAGLTGCQLQAARSILTNCVPAAMSCQQRRSRSNSAHQKPEPTASIDTVATT